MKKSIYLLVCTVLIVSGLNASAQTVKFTESFETWPPAGWTITSVLGAKVWSQGNTSQANLFPPFPDGSFVAAMEYETTGGDDWLITPQITGVASEDSLFFYFIKRFSDGPYPPDSAFIRVSTTGTNPADFTTLLLPICLHCLPVGTQTWSRVALPLSAFAGQNIYIGFRHINTDGHGMGLDLVQVVNYGTVGISDLKDQEWSVYPNPADHMLLLQSNLAPGTYEVQIHTLTGQLIHKSVVEQSLSTSEYTIDVSDIPAGAYVLSLTGSGTILHKRIVIE